MCCIQLHQKIAAIQIMQDGIETAVAAVALAVGGRVDAIALGSKNVCALGGERCYPVNAATNGAKWDLDFRVVDEACLGEFQFTMGLARIA